MRRASVLAAVLVLAAFSLAGCGSSALPTPTRRATTPATPTAAGLTETATLVPTFTATATATATATPTPTLTPTPLPPSLWSQVGVPEALRILAVEGNEVIPATGSESAEARLGLTEEPTSAEWVLVPVVPFPTLADDVAWEDIVAYWQGDAARLSYLADDSSAPALYCTAPVFATLVRLLGEPAEGITVNVVKGQEIVDAAWEARPASWAIVPFDELEPRWKALRLDGVSALEKGLADKPYALRLYFGIEGPRAAELRRPSFTNRDEEKMTVLVMTGVTAMAREIGYWMDQKGVLYPGEYVREPMRAADIAHVSNEIPFAENCPPSDFNQENLVFCSAPSYIDLLRDIGTDVIELTGNHFQDYGSEATILTVEMYDKEGWPHFGGGVDLEDARRPIVMTDHGNSISFMGCNPVGPEYAWAGEDYPGAAPCDFDYMHGELNRLREEVDVPIVTWQYWEFYFYEPTSEQQEDFRGMIDAGAKIVSGSQAHHPQAFEFYNGGFIHYGLGNFFFAQSGTPYTDLECLDRHIIYDGRHVSTEVLTYRLIDNSQPQPMTPEDRRQFLSELFAASGW